MQGVVDGSNVEHRDDVSDNDQPAPVCRGMHRPREVDAGASHGCTTACVPLLQTPVRVREEVSRARTEAGSIHNVPSFGQCAEGLPRDNVNGADGVIEAIEATQHCEACVGRKRRHHQERPTHPCVHTVHLTELRGVQTVHNSWVVGQKQSLAG